MSELWNGFSGGFWCEAACWFLLICLFLKYERTIEEIEQLRVEIGELKHQTVQYEDVR